MVHSFAEKESGVLRSEQDLFGHFSLVLYVTPVIVRLCPV